MDKTIQVEFSQQQISNLLAFLNRVQIQGLQEVSSMYGLVQVLGKASEKNKILNKRRRKHGSGTF